MNNDDIARVLKETADLLELTGGNPYRARAFSRAARSLQGLEAPVANRLREGTLTDVSGIGDAMADHVTEILEGGTFALHDELLSAVPPGLMDVLQVKGLGTKRTRRLWTELNVTSLDDLEQAAENDQIMALEGFGAKTQQKILENTRQQRRYNAQWHLDEAWTAAQPFLRQLRTIGAVERAELTGALRRRLETVEQAELIVATDRFDPVHRWIESHLEDPRAPEPSRIEGTLSEGVPVRIHLTAPHRFGTAWWRSTGSPNHSSAFEKTYGRPSDHAEETAVFEEAGLEAIPPELRERRGELEAAANGALPSLLTVDDVQGCLHNHSTYSDGSHTLREMAEAARSRGLSYFGICDHSQSLRIADGLSPEEVREQRAEVNRLNEEFDRDDGASFRVFHGIESDILSDGSLDYDDEILDAFDFVVASIHTGFNMTEEEATSRLIRAVEHPQTRILGHPTGRLLLRREGYPIDHQQVIEACAKHGVALELNANPYRFDLDWRWVHQATEQGVLISINPDAHAVPEIDYMRWGVAVGRKGWLTAEQCLNAKPLDAFTRWLEEGTP